MTEVIAVVFTLLMGVVVGRLTKRPRPHKCPDPDPRLERGISTIITISDRLMGPNKRSGRPPEDFYVVVRYSDLLKIWDIAERMKWMV